MTVQNVSNNEIVACVGSSIAAARGVYNWIRKLEKRPQNKRFEFVNRGVGGDVDYSTLQRLPNTIGPQRDRIILIIGANNIQYIELGFPKRAKNEWIMSWRMVLSIRQLIGA
jgi:hypothetical protein